MGSPDPAVGAGASPPTPSLAALVDHVATVPAAARESALQDLRLAVCTLTDRLKAEGAPPERVLIAVKVAVGAGQRGSAGAATHAREDLVADAVRWCITAYYRAD